MQSSHSTFHSLHRSCWRHSERPISLASTTSEPQFFVTVRAFWSILFLLPPPSLSAVAQFHFRFPGICLSAVRQKVPACVCTARPKCLRSFRKHDDDDDEKYLLKPAERNAAGRLTNEPCRGTRAWVTTPRYGQAEVDGERRRLCVCLWPTAWARACRPNAPEVKRAVGLDLEGV